MGHNNSNEAMMASPFQLWIDSDGPIQLSYVSVTQCSIGKFMTESSPSFSYAEWLMYVSLILIT